MLTRIASLHSGDFSDNRQNSALSSKGSCRYTYVAKSVSKLRKKEQFITAKENDRKCSLPRKNIALPRNVTVQAKGTEPHYQSRELVKLLNNNSVPNGHAKLQCHKEGLPNLKKKKRAVMAGEVNPRVRSPCLTKNSTPLKNKASKNPFINSSKRKRNAAGSVSVKTLKKRVKKINEVDCSIPISASASAVIDDDLESDLISSEISEQELLDLNLLPDGLLREKWITTPVSTLEKSERFIARGFHSFDGSRFSPIEEASLILKSTIADVSAIESCSIPGSLRKSAFVYDDFEYDLLSFESKDLNFLSEELFPEKQAITFVFTPKKSGRVTAERFPSFDGSRFSPIEEASLVLNGSIADVCAIELCFDPSSLRESAVVDDDFDCDLLSSEISQQELLDLNLLPDELFLEKWRINFVSTPKKSGRDAAEGFYSFDGSRFSPTEEASLVLNSPIPDVCDYVFNENLETTFEDIDLFESMQPVMMSGDGPTKMLQVWDVDVDLMLPLQFSPIQCFDPWAEDKRSTSEECALDDTCTWEGSTSDDLCSDYSSLNSLRIQTNLGTCPEASSDLTVELEENDFVKRSNEMCLCSFEDEAKKIVHELVASAGQPFKLPDGLLPEKHIITSSTLEKYKIVTAGRIHGFDGSRLSPIQEAFLILNSPIADVCACVADKESESTSEDIEFEEDQALGFQDCWMEDYGQLTGNNRDTSTYILNQSMDGTELQKIKDVDKINIAARIHRDDNPIPAPVPVSVPCLPESKDILSSCLALLRSGKKTKLFDYNSQDVKTLAEMKKIVKDRRLELLEAELLDAKAQIKELGWKLKLQTEILEVKTQIKELGLLLESSLRRTDIMQQKLARLSEP